MKKNIILLILIFISSCDINKSIDSTAKIDLTAKINKDNINIINEIWSQSLDKAINLYNTKTSAS